MIQVNVIQSATPDAFDYMCYPDQNPEMKQYLQNQFQNISHTLLESGRRFVEESRQMFEQFYDSSVERAARAAVRMAKNLRNPNSIVRFDSLEEIQGAAPLMQRYIMTEPYIREKFHKQHCSGFAGSYMDMDPGMYMNQQYDWRRVNDCMVRFEPGEDGEEEMVSTAFYEDLYEGDRDLTFDEKIDIKHVTELARLFMEIGEDATCPFGSKVG